MCATETKWGLWEPFCVYLRDLLYFSFSHFEDCCVVLGGFSWVLPLSHYSPVCHALWRGEEEIGSQREKQWTDELMEGRQEEVKYIRTVQVMSEESTFLLSPEGNLLYS